PETAKSGRDKIDWVRSYMPILNAIEKEFRKTKPFDGMITPFSSRIGSRPCRVRIWEAGAFVKQPVRAEGFG
ncbi:MAG: hypothetical protein SPL42_09285, partial [Bacteroidales bacterium]|nr:hypothetical protein [Bacteroidales bacterium]